MQKYNEEAGLSIPQVKLYSDLTTILSADFCASLHRPIYDFITSQTPYIPSSSIIDIIILSLCNNIELAANALEDISNAEEKRTRTHQNLEYARECLRRKLNGL
jgi:hypothetical protein